MRLSSKKLSNALRNFCKYQELLIYMLPHDHIFCNNEIAIVTIL